MKEKKDEQEKKKKKEGIDLPVLNMDVPANTVTGNTQNVAKQAKKLDDTQAEATKQEFSVQSKEHAKAIYEAYKAKFGEDDWYKERLKEPKDGKLSLSFKSPTDAGSFFNDQAKSGKNFIIVDGETNKVIGYSDGQKFYVAKADGSYAPHKEGEPFTRPSEEAMNKLKPPKGPTAPDGFEIPAAKQEQKEQEQEPQQEHPTQ